MGRPFDAAAAFEALLDIRAEDRVAPAPMGNVDAVAPALLGNELKAELAEVAVIAVVEVVACPTL
jgi:hypothetical protein